MAACSPSLEIPFHKDFLPILHDIQLARPFADSKTFVDMPLGHDVSLQDLVTGYQNLKKYYPHGLQNDTNLHLYLKKYFLEAGNELSQVDVNGAKYTGQSSNLEISNFVQNVVDIWPSLTRKTNPVCKSCISTLIPLKNSFVVAGGRFRESYYWDSFFIIEGLLRSGSEYVQIARNMILNFVQLVKELGFVPNGSRTYYKFRSQPPFLTQMVRVYIENTGDVQFLEEIMSALEMEYQYWMKGKKNVKVAGRNGKTYSLTRYYSDDCEPNIPRPESYFEDYNNSLALKLSNSSKGYDQSQISFFKEIATGAESGWDFSSRFLDDPPDISSIKAREIIPVDLNSIMYYNELVLSKFHYRLNNTRKSLEYARLAEYRKDAIHNVFFSKGDDYAGYFDYNITSETINPGFSPSSYYPLWARAVRDDVRNNTDLMALIFEPLETRAKLYPGGIPTSDRETAQQWDGKNAWPPLQYLMMQASLAHNKSDIAISVAQKYLANTYCTFQATKRKTGTGMMFEKYNATKIGLPGSGGEYEVVPGFGWSNGVLIWTVDQFGKSLKTPQCLGLETHTESVNAAFYKSVGIELVVLALLVFI